MKRFTSYSQKKGEVGEKIALKYLKDTGFSIIETNFTRKIGEIDIIASLQNKLHFIEVKTLFMNNVSCETGIYSPFENVSREKMRKIGKTCELFILERGVPRETSWQIDVIAVTVSHETKSAKIDVLWNIV